MIFIQKKLKINPRSWRAFSFTCTYCSGGLARDVMPVIGWRHHSDGRVSRLR